MRLTTFTDYALRVLLYVATAPDRRATIAETAHAYGISENHLVKVAHLLGKEGFLVTTRGRAGGLRLAQPPAAINIARVVRATEGPSALAECFEPRGRCPIAGACRLERVLGEAEAAFYETLQHYTLQDLVSRPRRLAAILHRTPHSPTGDSQ